MYHEIHSSAHLPQWVLGPPVEFRAATRTDAYFALRLQRGHIRTCTKNALTSLAITNWAPRSGRQENLNCGRNNIWNFLPEFPIKQEPDGAIYNLHTEWDHMFPFGYTPQALFKVFERFMALDDTATILKAVNDDLTFLALSRDRDIRKIRENAVVTCTARDTAATIRSTLAIPPAQSIAEFLLAKNSAMVDAFESAKLIEDLRSRFLSLSISRSWFPRLNEIQKELEGILGRESAEREGTEKSKNQPGVIPVPEEKEMATRPAQGTGNETKNEQNQSKTGGNAPEASGVVPAAKPQLEPASALCTHKTSLKTSRERHEALWRSRSLWNRAAALPRSPKAQASPVIQPLERPQALFGLMGRSRGLHIVERALEGFTAAPAASMAYKCGWHASGGTDLFFAVVSHVCGTAAVSKVTMSATQCRQAPCPRRTWRSLCGTYVRGIAGFSAPKMSQAPACRVARTGGAGACVWHEWPREYCRGRSCVGGRYDGLLACLEGPLHWAWQATNSHAPSMSDMLSARPHDFGTNAPFHERPVAFERPITIPACARPTGQKKVVDNAPQL